MRRFKISPPLRFVNAGIAHLFGRCMTIMAVALCFTACISKNDRTSLPRGTGTADDPYLISSMSELKYLEEQTAAGNYFSGEYFEMTNDIDLENEDVQISRFCGTFDGKGYTIRNLNIQDSGQVYYALFNFLYRGTICNLNVEGTIYLAHSAFKDDIPCYVGGVVAVSDDSTVKNCTFKGDITVDVTNYYLVYVGGVVGCVGHSSKVMGCAFLGGTVTGIHSNNGVSFVGGVISYIHGSYVIDSYVIGCYNAGTVIGSYGCAGGVVGSYNNIGMVACYNHGTVTGDTADTGSLAGYCEGITVTACYDTQTSNLQFAGYVGSKATFNTCYWLEDSNYSFLGYGDGASTSDCVSKTEEELKSQDTVDALNTAIENWNSSNSNLCTYRFAVDADGGYPVLVEQ